MRRILIFLFMALMLVSSLIVWAESGESEIARADQLWANHFTQGMTEKAIGVLGTIVEQEPDNYEALWRLGRCYQFLGEVSFNKERTVAIEKGLSFTGRAVKINDQGVNGHLWHALLVGSNLQDQRDPGGLGLVKQMHDELQTVVRLEPQNGIAHFALAQLYHEAPGKPVGIGDKKKALTEAALAVKHMPSNNDAWIYYGYLEQENGDFAAARVAYARFLDNTGSFKKYSVLVGEEEQPGQDYETLWHLGYFYEFYGRNCPVKKEKLAAFERGLSYTEEALKLNPNGVNGHLYKALLTGDIGLEKGISKGLAMVKPMCDELQTVINLEPGNAIAHYALGQLYWTAPGKPLSIGDKKKALEETALAVKYDPQNIEYWFYYGKIAADNKDYKTAKTAFTKVLNFFGGQRDFKAEAQKELNRLGDVKK